MAPYGSTLMYRFRSERAVRRLAMPWPGPWRQVEVLGELVRRGPLGCQPATGYVPCRLHFSKADAAARESGEALDEDAHLQAHTVYVVRRAPPGLEDSAHRVCRVTGRVTPMDACDWQADKRRRVARG